MTVAATICGLASEAFRLWPPPMHQPSVAIFFPFSSWASQSIPATSTAVASV